MAEQMRGNGEAELARIDSLIASTRRTLRSGWVLTGAGLTLGLCLAAIVITAVIDLVVPLPTLMRLAALLVIVVPTALALMAGVFRPAARRISENHIARRVERLVPQIQSRLVTTLDIAHDRTQHRQSPAFFERLVAETTERVGNFRPSAVVDRKNLQRAAGFALTAMLVFAGVLTFFHERLPTALARIFAPFADIPPATGVRFTAEPGDAKTLKGDDVTIAAVLEKGDPREMELEFRTPGGKWVRQPMQRAAPGRFELTLAQLDNSIEYRLLGGGTWTTRNRIEVVERPDIVGLQTVVRYPAYMKLPDPKVSPPHSPDATGPVGSDVEIVVDVAGQAVEGEIQLLTHVTTMRPVTSRRERVWFENKIPDGARPDGNWQWDFALKFRAAHTEPPAAGQHGHGFQAASVGFEIEPGESIYSNVLVVRGHAPEEIMLQFHDGKDWEHRAFWGADKIQAGVPNTPSRARLGEIPPAGEWVRLEVPASAVGLEGKKISGILYLLFGGQCKWNRAGTIDPAEVPERSSVVASTYAMERKERNQSSPAASAAPKVAGSTVQPFNRSTVASTSTSTWSGHFPLTRDGTYRVEFKNELGYGNKRMTEGKLTAIPDNPPHVMIERPGADLVLSQPQRVPLVVRADDDFGLSDISLAVQKGDSGGFVGAPIKVFDDPVRVETVVAALDLEPHQLKPGELVRYRVQARDRKGQIAQTQDFVVRIQQDNNAADKQLAAIAQQQEAFQNKLEQLIGQQAKVAETVDTLAGRESLADSSEAKMAELRQEFAKLAGQQDANVQLGAQVQAELSQTATQAANSKLVPELLAAQMRVAEQLFQNQALQPMRDLLQSMQQAGDPQKPNPDLNAMAASAERIQQQLQAMKSRLDALAAAQRNMTDDPAAALAKLRQQLLAQNAELTAEELAELRDFLDRLAGQMKLLEGRENDLARQTKDAMPVVLPEIDREQSKIEADAAKLLAQAEPFAEAENPEPPSAELQAKDAAAKEHDANMAEGDDDLFMPPAGVKEKLDPRFAKKARPAAKKGDANAKSDAPQSNSPRQDQPQRPQSQPPANDMRAQLADRQQQTAQQLHAAQQQLETPREQLAQLIKQLREALGPESDEAAQELAQLMRSMDMQQAIRLAQAMRQAQARDQSQPPAGQPAQQAQLAPPQPQSTATQPNTAMRLGVIGEFDANEIDLAAQAVMLRMQPRLREELLKGMREEGPEAYRKFIQDYFNRLTKVKSSQ